MDRIINFVYGFVRDWSNATFYIIMGVIAALAFYFLSLFLKANKKEAPKVSKVSYLLMSIFMLVVIIVLTNIRY